MATRIATPPSLAPPPPPVMKNASLYVGDLHPEATELDLLDLLSKIGQLHSVRLCRDRVFPHKSLCYAYINFLSPFDASIALSLLNHTELKGKPMRIMWCQRDPLIRKTGIANLFVKNLDSSVTSARLHTIFSTFGAILSCKVAEENGKSKGFGFVQFDLEESALNALAALHDSILEGKKLYVSKFVKKSERKDACEEPRFTNLYVKNIEKGVTEDLLQEKFSEYGNVYNVTIMKDSEGKSKGFGFVNFESPEAAKKALEALNGVLLGSKKLFVGKAQKKAERAEHLKHAYGEMPSDLYVKNLSLPIDDRKLKNIFSVFGEVTSAKVMRHDNGVSKGFGFVSFSNPGEGKKALKSINGTVVEGRSLCVSVAQRKEESSKHLQINSSTQTKQPQSLRTSKWDVLAPPFIPSNYSLPPLIPTPISASRALSSQPKTNQYLGNYEGAWYTLGTLNYQGSYSRYIPMRQSQQGTNTKKNVAYQHHNGHGGKLSGVRTEMNESDTQKILCSPSSLAKQVGEAIKVRAAYSSKSGTDGCVVGPVSKSVHRQLSY